MAIKFTVSALSPAPISIETPFKTLLFFPALAVSAPSYMSSTLTSILQAIFSTLTPPTTPSASSPSVTPKFSYTAIAGTRTPKPSKIEKATFSALPSLSTTLMLPTTLKIAKATFFAALTPITTPKIAKLTFTISKPVAYMTMEDLFRKFASCNT